MNLQVESFVKESKQELAVANYVSADDRRWLQSRRIELNAMSTPQFLEWLDLKFAPYRGKVIPPDKVLKARLEEEVRGGLERGITRAILRRAGIDARVSRAFDRRSAAIDAAGQSLADTIKESFGRDPSKPWVDPLSRVARKIVRP